MTRHNLARGAAAVTLAVALLTVGAAAPAHAAPKLFRSLKRFVTRNRARPVSAHAEQTLLATSTSVVKRWNESVKQLEQKKGRGALSLAGELATAVKTATSDGTLELSRAGRRQQRATMREAFKLAQKEANLWLGIAQGMVDVANVDRSASLKWTRDVKARPGSDWGIYGVGEVFREKRSALTNLSYARGNINFMRKNLADLTWLAEQVGEGGWAKQLSSKLTKLQGDADQARKALASATPDIWRAQWVVTAGADPSQIEVLKAMFLDRPEDQKIIDAHINAYRGSR